MLKNIKQGVFYLLLGLIICALSGCELFLNQNPITHEIINKKLKPYDTTPVILDRNQKEGYYPIYAIGPTENSENIYMSNDGQNWIRTQGIGYSISSGRSATNFNYWVVGTGGSLWRLGKYRWVKFNIKNKNVFKKAYDIGAGYDGQVYAVGDYSIGSNGLQQNIYKLKNNKWISIQGLASRVDIDVNGGVWIIGGAPNYGTIYELVEGRGWVLRRGINNAIDIGCGLRTYVTTNSGDLKVYKNSDWVDVQLFDALGVKSSRVDCSLDGSLIVTDADGNAFISDLGTKPFVKTSLNRVSDVSIAKE